MVDNGAKTTSLNAGGSYTIPAGYHNGSGKVTANSLVSQTPANAIASDILSGKNAWVNGVKVNGSMLTAPTYPNELTAKQMHCYGSSYTSHDGNNIYMQIPESRYYPSGTWIGFSDPDLVPANIKNGVSIGSSEKPVVGTFTSDANASASHILAGYSGYVKGSKINGSIPSQTAKTITPSTSSQIAVASGRYTTGDIIVAAVPTEIKNITPTANGQQINPSSGKFFSSVYVEGYGTRFIVEKLNIPDLTWTSYYNYFKLSYSANDVMIIAGNYKDQPSGANAQQGSFTMVLSQVSDGYRKMLSGTSMLGGNSSGKYNYLKCRLDTTNKTIEISIERNASSSSCIVSLTRCYIIRGLV